MVWLKGFAAITTAPVMSGKFVGFVAFGPGVGGGAVACVPTDVFLLHDASATAAATRKTQRAFFMGTAFASRAARPRLLGLRLDRLRGGPVEGLRQSSNPDAREGSGADHARVVAELRRDDLRRAARHGRGEVVNELGQGLREHLRIGLPDAPAERDHRRIGERDDVGNSEREIAEIGLPSRNRVLVAAGDGFADHLAAPLGLRLLRKERAARERRRHRERVSQKAGAGGLRLEAAALAARADETGLRTDDVMADFS